LVWLCVPDGAIASAAQELAHLADWKGKIALHSSGALGSEELAALRQRGAHVASAHPLMTFVRGSAPLLSGVPFALEGDPDAVQAAKRIVRDLGGRSFLLKASRKHAYHAWSTFASPLLLVLLATMEDVAKVAGLDQKHARRGLLPIARQTLENYAALGAENAFSGPIIRGDVDTVARHLEVLQKIPEARDVYLALARSALKNLPVGNRREIRTLIMRDKAR
jgi:predicted short-subunit dehydrogenase-like oxidoreductase (DUF2520 family)